MQYKTLQEFEDASFMNQLLWVREAPLQELATVVQHNKTFAEAVMKCVGSICRDKLTSLKPGDYESALKRLLTIQFEEYVSPDSTG